MEFGKVMKSIREKNNWTLDEMAKKLGTTKQSLSKYERGERTPKITVAAKFAKKLGVPLAELTGEPDTKLTSRLEVTGEKPQRSFAVDVLSSRIEPGSTLKYGIHNAEVKEVVVDKDLAAFMKVWNVATPGKRKEIVRVVEAMNIKGE